MNLLFVHSGYAYRCVLLHTHVVTICHPRSANLEHKAALAGDMKDEQTNAQTSKKQWVLNNLTFNGERRSVRRRRNKAGVETQYGVSLMRAEVVSTF